MTRGGIGVPLGGGAGAVPDAITPKARPAPRSPARRPIRTPALNAHRRFLNVTGTRYRPHFEAIDKQLLNEDPNKDNDGHGTALRFHPATLGHEAAIADRRMPAGEQAGCVYSERSV
jgi:hypothetical protein